jgi:hypothetical protein
MLKKVAAALIAVTMFSAPVLAQSVAPVSPTPAPQTIKATKSPVKHVTMKKHTVKKHTVKKHAVKKVRVARHHMHVKHVRHAKAAKLAHSARLSPKPAPARTN